MSREEFTEEQEQIEQEIYDRTLVTQDVRYQIEQYKQKVDQTVETVKELTIESRYDGEMALKIACEAINLADKIEETKKEILEPSKKFQSEVNTLAKEFVTKLECVKETVVEKIDQWKDRTKLFSILATGRSDENRNLETAQIVACEKDNIAFDLIDLDKVPREFLTVDEAMLRQAVKSGRRVIPGINITQTKKTYLRRKVA